MIQHNLTLAWRQLVKYRLQSAVSVVSLAIGFACFALAMLWIRYERTFDTQHPDADRLYMVYQKEELIVREPLAGYLASNLPEAEMVTKIVPGQNTILIDGVKHEINEMQCDSSFLKTMGIRVVSGNADFWMHRHQYAVTEEFAAKAKELALEHKLHAQEDPVYANTQYSLDMKRDALYEETAKHLA